MQKCIAGIRDWMLSDRLKLDDDKTEFIIIGTRQQLAKVNIDPLRVSDSTFTPASEVKNLGTWFDRQLKMDAHIKNICNINFGKLLFSHLYNIRRIRKFLSLDCTHILVKAFVTSCLDYLFIYFKQYLVGSAQFSEAGLNWALMKRKKQHKRQQSLVWLA